MSGGLLISYIALWVLVVVMLVVLLICIRQLGLVSLQLRQGTAPLEHGPSPGARLQPFLERDDRTGREVRLPDPNAALTALYVTSAHCAMCRETLPHLESTIGESDMAGVVLCDGEPQDNEDLARLVSERVGFVSSEDRFREIGTQVLPLVLVVEPNGRVISRRVVNEPRDLADIVPDDVQVVRAGSHQGEEVQ